LCLVLYYCLNISIEDSTIQTLHISHKSYVGVRKKDSTLTSSTLSVCESAFASSP